MSLTSLGAVSWLYVFSRFGIFVALNMMGDFYRNLNILCHRTLNLTYPCVLLTVRRTTLCGGVQVPTGPLLPAHRCAPLPWSPDSPSGDDMGTSAPRDSLPECPPDSALQLGGWHPAAVGRSPPLVACVAGRSLSWTLAERAVLVLFVCVCARCCYLASSAPGLG